LVPFLTRAIEKLGLWTIEERYHTFLDSLCKQLRYGVLSIPFEANEIDSILINFKNGTLKIDERGYKLRKFDSKDFITYQLSFDYDEEATSPMWNKFLDEVLPADKNDPEGTRQKVLAEYFGSCFTNKPKIEKALFCYGSGENGKTVIQDVIEALFGEENISRCSLDNLCKHSHFRAKLNNKLLNLSSETSKHVDSETFKNLASKEPIDVDRKFENAFTMRNYARLAFNANELPQAGKEYILAFKRRLVIIPFDVHIEKSKQDVYLADKIIEKELSGVFNWILRGLDRLRAQGRLTECEASDREVDKYMIEGDTVAQWLEDEEWIEDKELKPKDCIQLKELCKDYGDWCDKYRQTKGLGRDRLRKRLSEMHNIHSFEYRHKQYYRLRKEVPNESIETLY
jgi:putative DNA primase/helicase